MKLQISFFILLFFNFLHCFDVKQPHFEHKANFTCDYNLRHQKINPILFTDSYSAQSSSVIWLPSKKLMQQATTKEVWCALCKAYGPDIDKRHVDILKLHQYYKYPSFIEIIKSFDEYPAYIIALAKKLHTSKLKFFFMHKKIRKKIYTLSDEVIAKQEIERRKIKQAELVQRQRAIKINRIDSALELQKDELENLSLHYQDLLQMNTLTDTQCLRYAKRIEGIQNYLKGNSNYYDASYANKFLNGFGNELQHVAYAEFENALNSYSQVQKKLQIQDLHDLLLNSAHTGSQLAQSGHITKAFSCADLCFAIVDFSQAIAQGVFDGASNVINMGLHPIATVQNIVYGLATITYHMSKTLYDLSVIGANYCINPQVAQEQWPKFCDRISQTCGTIFEELQQQTTHNVVRKVTAFAVETVLMTKLLSSAHKVCNIAKNNLTEFIKITEVEEVILISTEGIPFKTSVKPIKTRTVSLMENCESDTVARITQKVNNMNELFELPYWKNIKKYCEKTGKNYHGQQIYRVIKNIEKLNLFKGDYFFINALHKDHIEIYNKIHKLTEVKNLNGIKNIKLTNKKVLRIGPLANKKKG